MKKPTAVKKNKPPEQWRKEWNENDTELKLDGIDGASKTRKWMIAELLKLSIRVETEKNNSTHDEFQQQLIKILAMLRMTELQIRNSVYPSVTSYGTNRWKFSEEFEIQLDAFSDDKRIYLMKYAIDGCNDPNSCKRVSEEFFTIANFAAEAGHIVGQWYTATTSATIKAINSNADTWVKYRNEKKPMYWWEAAINEAIVSTPEDGTQPAPTYQVIFMHPAPSFQYVGGASSGIKPGISLEVIGFNLWEWGEDGDFTAPFGVPYLKALGVSAVINYSEREQFRNLSYGAMVHFNHTYSIGLTRGRGPEGNVTQVMFTVDILKSFQSKSQKVKNLEQQLAELRRRF